MPGRVTADNVSEVTRYHPPAPGSDRAAAHEAINAATEVYMRVILQHAPECADRSEALRWARGARLWSNSAIALNGLI